MIGGNVHFQQRIPDFRDGKFQIGPQVAIQYVELKIPEIHKSSALFFTQADFTADIRGPWKEMLDGAIKMPDLEIHGWIRLKIKHAGSTCCDRHIQHHIPDTVGKSLPKAGYEGKETGQVEHAGSYL